MEPYKLRRKPEENNQAQFQIDLEEALSEEGIIPIESSIFCAENIRHYPRIVAYESRGEGGFVLAYLDEREHRKHSRSTDAVLHYVGATGGLEHRAERALKDWLVFD